MTPDNNVLQSHVVRALQELDGLESYTEESLINADTEDFYTWQCVRKVIKILKDGMQLSVVGEGAAE